MKNNGVYDWKSKNSSLIKALRIMKLSLFLIITCTLGAMASSSYSQTKTLSLSADNSSLKEVLNEIEEQSEFYFMYSEKIIDINREVSIRLDDQNINTVLSDLFEGTNVNFLVTDRIIVLTTPDVFTDESSAKIQQKTVTGMITDENGSPIIGATVLEKGTSKGTITNAEGRYSIQNVPDNATLVFSFIGMQTQEIIVGNRTNIDVVMLNDAIGLEEVIAVGYGTRMKGELTGSISKVGEDIFEARPITNTLNALQGALPGVTVTKGSGRPGRENYDFQIRGISSVAGSSPLILIDGIPGDLSTINPNDIQSVTVLKDAAASIYGARAADGVLIVTTKSGKKGKLSVSYSGNYGFKTPAYVKQMTNTLQMAEMYDEGMRNIGQQGVTEEVFEKIRTNAPPDINGGWMRYLENYPGFYGNTDWIDELFGNGEQQIHNLSISGGGEESTYMFSTGYRQDGGILNYGTDKSEVYNLRFNFGFKLGERLKVETRTAFDSHSINEPTGVNSALWLGNLMWSYLPVYNPGGDLYMYQGYINPIQSLLEGGKGTRNQNKFETNIRADLKIFKDLKLVTQMGVRLGLNDTNYFNRTYRSTNWQGGLQRYENKPNSAWYENSKNTYGSYTTYLDYNKTIAGKHQLGIMGGASHEQNDYQRQWVPGYNFPSNDLYTLNLADKTDLAYMNTTGSANDWALNSFFGRLSYSYDRKINVDFTARLDGSSKFAPSLRWSALFPAASASWNISQEDFMESFGVFDLLKIRASWGQSGNQNLSFGNYDYIPLITISGKYPLGSPNVGLPGAVASIASEARTWETIETTNAGIDFSILDSRLSGSFDYFVKQNNNMLVSVTLPATLGGTSPTQNLGTLITKGWDMALSWSDSKGDFSYSVSAILGDNKTKLTELLGNDNYWEGVVYTREGYPLNSFFGYESDGIIKTQEQLDEYKELGNVPTNINLGDMMYKDLDGDGKITPFGDPDEGYEGDMKYLGDMNPRYVYSSNINLSYKNWDVSMLLQGVGRRSNVRTGAISRPFHWVWYQPPVWFYEKTWTPDRPDAEYPRIVPGGLGWDDLNNWNYRYSDKVINDLSYVRLKSPIIAYNIPLSITSRINMQGIRVYASGQDLLTFSKGTWGNSYDPEEERSDYQTYPFTKVISFGIEVDF